MCPFEGFEPATMKFCEENLCSYIKQPANTWSNLAYIFVGIFLWFKIRKETNSSSLLLFSISAVLVGINSFLYHASFIFYTQVLDLTSMFLLSCLLIAFNLKRAGWIQEKKLNLIYLLSVLISLALLLLIKKKSGEYIFGIHIGIALFLELLIVLRKNIYPKYRNLQIAIGIFLISYIAWILDITGILCSPDNHFLQGHAAWHIINSFCFIYLYLFYKDCELT